jgi:predicted DNA binding protein
MSNRQTNEALCLYPSYDGCLVMIEAVLRIAAESYYSCEITERVPVRISLITINGPEGFGIIESLDGTEAPLKRYAQSMKRSKSILEFEITYKSNTQYWTRAVHRMEGPTIHQTVLESGCMTRLPIIIANGKQTHTVLSPSQEAFSTLYENLRQRFTSVELERVRRYPTGLIAPLLSRKQEEAFRIAFQQGYYEIPRKCDLEELARKTTIKRVAFQERLRRAERTIMREFARSHGLMS